MFQLKNVCVFVFVFIQMIAETVFALDHGVYLYPESNFIGVPHVITQTTDVSDVENVTKNVKSIRIVGQYTVTLFAESTAADPSESIHQRVISSHDSQSELIEIADLFVQVNDWAVRPQSVAVNKLLSSDVTAAIDYVLNPYQATSFSYSTEGEAITTGGDSGSEQTSEPSTDSLESQTLSNDSTSVSMSMTIESENMTNEPSADPLDPFFSTEEPVASTIQSPSMDSSIGPILDPSIDQAPSSVPSVNSIVGALRGDMAVDRGALGYSLPLATPSGVHSMNPGIVLQYSERAPNNIVGPGFMLNAGSAITRCTPTSLVDGFEAGIQLNESARFCHDGNHLVLVGGQHGSDGAEYRGFDNRNIQYVAKGGSHFTPDQWLVKTPEGVSIEFQRIGSSSDIYATWVITKRSDLFGNAMNYYYRSSNGAPLLERIVYSGYRVDFEYQSRAYPFGYYQDGQLIQNSEILDIIRIAAPNGELLYFYDFTYETLETPQKVQRLKEITQCYDGQNRENNEHCVQPVAFHYQAQPDPNIVTDRQQSDLKIIVPEAVYAADGNLTSTESDVVIEQLPSYSVADLTGNGFSDFCYYRVGEGVMCAINDNGTYRQPTAWTGDLGFTATIEDQEAYGQLHLGDLNLDGKADFCLVNEEGVLCGLNSKDTSGFSTPSYWNITVNKSFSGISFSFIDEDELLDLCGADGNGRMRCFAGNGTSFTKELSGFSDVYVAKKVRWHYLSGGCIGNACPAEQQSYEANFPSPQLVDIDGDFDKDLCWISESSKALVCKKAYTNLTTNQRDYEPARMLLDFSELITPMPVVDESAVYSLDEHRNFDRIALEAVATARNLFSSFRFINLNGDTLLDVCYLAANELKCHINTGRGFSPSQTWFDASAIFYNLEDEQRAFKASTFRYVDRNLDGRTELCLIHSEYEQCANNNGNGFDQLKKRLKLYSDVESTEQTRRAWLNFMHKIWGGSRIFLQYHAVKSGYGNLVEVPDLDNDGHSEFCYRSIWGIACSDNDNYGPAALLNGVTDGFGLRTDVLYQSLTDGLYESADSIPEGFREQRFDSRVVAALITDVAVQDKVSKTQSRKRMDYRYGGYLISDDGETSGFSFMKEQVASRGYEKTTRYYQSKDLFGEIRRSETRINDVLIKEMESHVGVDKHANGTQRTRLDKTIEKQYDLDGSLHVSTETNYDQYDLYGYVGRIAVTKTQGSEVLKTTTHSSYLHNTTLWLLGSPTLQKVTHDFGGTSEVREVRYEYDQGKLVRQIQQPNSDYRLTIEYSDFSPEGFPKIEKTIGKVSTSGAEQTRQVTTQRDDLGRSISQTNALNQTVLYRYHPRCGGVISETDIAGRVTQTGYNRYCQKSYVDYPDNNFTFWVTEWASEADQSDAARAPNWDVSFFNPIVYKVTETHLTGHSQGAQFSTAFIDAEGRTVRTLATGFSSNLTPRNVQTESVFDTRGNRVRFTEPFYVFPSGCTSALIYGCQTTPRWTDISYDEIKRPVTEEKIGPDKQNLTVSYHYSGSESTISYSDYSKNTVSGVHGKPISVTENGLTTSYEYTPIGNLQQTLVNTVQKTVLFYDDRGYKSRQIDPTMGEWHYQHNAFGELIYQRDANNQVTEFFFDALGSQYQRKSPEGIESWSWYTNGPGIGQLEREQGIESEKRWVYDSFGRMKSETLLVEGRSFSTGYTYDAFSRLVEVSHPNDVSLFQRYDNLGRLQNVSIPARDFDGIDFDFLRTERDRLLEKLAEFEKLQQVALRNAEAHAKAALEYHAKYQQFIEAYYSVDQKIRNIDALAREHDAMAQQYLERYQYYLQKAADIRAQLGSGTYYKKTREDSEFYYYTHTYCASYHGWGPTKYCHKYQTNEVEVAKSDLEIENPSDPNDPLTIVVQESMDPVKFFDQLAQEYQFIAAETMKVAEDHVSTLGTQSGVAHRTVSEIDEDILEKLLEYIDIAAERAKVRMKNEKLTKEQQRWLATTLVNSEGYIWSPRQAPEQWEFDYAINWGWIGAYWSHSTYVSNGHSIGTAVTSYKHGDRWHFHKLGAVNDMTNGIQGELNTLQSSLLQKRIQLDNLKTTIASYQDTANFDQSEKAVFDNIYAYVESQANLEGRRDKQNKVYAVYEQYRDTYVYKPCGFRVKCTDPGPVDFIPDSMIQTEQTLADSQFIQWSSNSNFSSPYTMEENRNRIRDLISAEVYGNTDEINRLQGELRASLTGFDNSSRAYLRPKIVEKQIHLPIFVDGIAIVTLATVSEEIVDGYEMTTDEAREYYKSMADTYYQKMEESLAFSSQQMDNYVSGTNDQDLAATEAIVENINETLSIIDGSSLDGLAESQNRLNETGGRLTLWHAALRSPKGNLQTEVFGNALYTHRELSLQSGLVEQIVTKSVGGSAIRSLTYQYDNRGRITAKTDSNDLGNTTEESFKYTDNQGRLSDWSFSQSVATNETSEEHTLNHSYQHDAFGNLTFKTDAGNMSYSAGSNRLISRSHNGVTSNYAYDPNGNMLHGDNRFYIWNSFNKVKRVAESGQSVEFSYDANRKRVVKRSNAETIYYVSSGYEMVIRNGVVTHRHTIWSGNDSVAVLEKQEEAGLGDVEKAKSTDKVSYIHRDILGSGEVMTNGTMEVIARRYYSPYGRLIDDLLSKRISEGVTTSSTEGVEDLGEATWEATDQEGVSDELMSRYKAGKSMDDLSGVRGFTSHEEVKEVSLINMNARMYDPVIGRFASADSMIPDALTPLDYNRYAYVRGNPVIARDPTGHWGHIVAAVAFAATTMYGDSPTWQTIGSVVLAATIGHPDFGLAANAGMEGMKAILTEAAVTSLTLSYMQTGKIGRDGIKNAAFSMLTAGASHGIAQSGWVTKTSLSTSAQYTRLVAAQMITHGAIASLRGDKFIHGAVSALGSKVSGFATRGVDPMASAVIAGAIGGAFAEAAGGDFKQGALTAAFLHLYNELGGERRKASRRATSSRGSTKMPQLAEGRYLAVIDSFSAEMLVDVEVGDLWIIDFDNNQHLHFGVVGFGGGVTIGSSASRQFGALYVSSTSSVEGFSFQVEVDGTPVLGGTGAIQLLNQSLDLPTVSGGIAVGFEVGISGVTNYTWFKKVYDAADSPMWLFP